MKYIKDWEGKYSITEDGRVWAHERIITTKSRWGGVINKRYKEGWLSVNTTKKGDWYMSIALQETRSFRKGYKVHRLVAEAFIPNPLGLKEVNHKNGIKTDNRVENLEWCTHKGNMQHASENGLMNSLKGEDSPSHKLTEVQVLDIKNLLRDGEVSMREISRMYGVTLPTIRGINLGWQWSQVGDIPIPCRSILVCEQFSYARPSRLPERSH